MNESKPTVVYVARNGKTCPVCHQKSYSRDGIHPQCAALKADEPRRIKLAAEKKADGEKKKNPDIAAG